MSHFTFQPKTERELVDLLDAGDGDFEIIDAKDRESKKGSPMIELKLNVFDANGKSKHVYDYLVLTEHNLCQRKIRNCCYAVGLDKQYESGSLSSVDFAGKKGKLTIDIDDKDPAYPPKNIIRDYIGRDKIAKTESKEEFKDSDIPW